jgi:hypothetical protein
MFMNGQVMFMNEQFEYCIQARNRRGEGQVGQANKTCEHPPPIFGMFVLFQICNLKLKLYELDPNCGPSRMYDRVCLWEIIFRTM